LIFGDFDAKPKFNATLNLMKELVIKILILFVKKIKLKTNVSPKSKANDEI